jgi:site-specific DNA-methyltransferase (adenine-specific)
MCTRRIGPFPCCSIICGDSGKLLSRIPAQSIPLVICDPPYGIRFVSNHRLVLHAPMYGDSKFPKTIVQQAIDSASHAAYVFCDLTNLIAGDLPEPATVLAWVKNHWGMGDLKHNHGPQWEPICFYPRSRHAFVKRIPDVIYAARTGNNFHPTQKPVDLIRHLIQANVGDTVLDPFVGSGTTCVAAKQLGRHFLGFELDEKHYKTALARCDFASGQMDLGTPA